MAAVLALQVVVIKQSPRLLGGWSEQGVCQENFISIQIEILLPGSPLVLKYPCSPLKDFSSFLVHEEKILQQAAVTKLKS